ncbi:choice-of-anchor G family protein [Microbacterium phosphatis]|uniref:choice-of-anchor G family protein n=1 Tax=Microbacterium phosphatis TaxID=3140248 RepID=UPI00314008C1
MFAPVPAVADTGPGTAGVGNASAQLVELGALLDGVENVAAVNGATLSFGPDTSDAAIQAQGDAGEVKLLTTETAEYTEAVDAGVLASIPVNVPQIELGGTAVLGSILNLGAVTQYAKVSGFGSSIAYAGTVTDMPSAISAGSGGYEIHSWDNAEPAASIDLDAGAVSVQASIGALYALARDNHWKSGTPIHSTSYDVAGVELNVGGDLISGGLNSLEPLLTTLGVDLEAAGVVDFTTNTVKVSLDELLEPYGADSVNDLPARTNILKYLPNAVVGIIDETVTELLPDGGALDIVLKPVLDQVVGLLSGLSNTLLTPLTGELEGLLALYVNNIADEGGVLSVTALEANIGSGALVLPLAKATVGANVKSTLSSGVPKITGTAAVGQTLTVSPGTGWVPSTWHITSTNAANGSTWFTYQWQRDGKSIPGATSATYKPVAADAGHILKVRVQALNNFMNGAAAMTAKGVTVAVPKITTSITPKIAGTPAVGQKLTMNFGTVTPSGTTPRVSWYVDGKWVALASSYTVKSADKGKQVSTTWALDKAGYTTLKGAAAPVTVK